MDCRVLVETKTVAAPLPKPAEQKKRRFRRTFRRVLVLLFVCSSLLCVQANAQISSSNVNMVSGTQWPGGDPFLQRQNEPSVAVSTRNSLHMLAGANDYRTVDLPGLPNGQVTGDAWLGLFKTIDAGQTWFSLLLPGYPQDTSPDGLASPLKGFAAAADPTVRAGTNGLFYYSGIAFNRGAQGASVAFVARYIDNNNQENGDPLAYVGTGIVASSSGSVFIDKPWVAVDIPRTGAPMCRIATRQPDGSIQLQSFRAGTVYVAYSALTSGAGGTLGQIMFSRSTDCGYSWSKPIQISRSADLINQGATIAIDPGDGSVYVAWRRFASPATPQSPAQSDAMLVVRSVDGGQSFSAAMVAREMLPGQQQQVNSALTVDEEDIDPFDQGTSNVSFRFNAYPTLAIDGAKDVYLAWSERGIGPGGDSRIMIATAPESTFVFSSPNPVENPPTRGHQLMPSLAFSGGKLVVAFYDLRNDSSEAQYTALGGGQYSKTEVPVGDLAPPSPQPDKVFNSFIADAAPPGSSPIQRRHTVEVRAAQASPGAAPVFSPSVQVSDYLFGSRPGSMLIEQLQFNPPNLPLFVMGTDPFFGDYIDLAPVPAFLPGPSGTWTYNTAASPAPVFTAVWTDNRDVRPPLDGDWTHYTPPTSPSVQGTSLFDPTQQVPACIPGQEGMRNQNVYNARITQGLLAGSLGNTKPLGNATLPDGRVVQIQRGFVVFAQNTQSSASFYRMTITNQPAGGKASFLQFAVPGQPDPLTQVDLQVPAYSTASRTVFITSSLPKASVLVSVQQITGIGGMPVPGGLQSSVLLNPDVTNPSISNPSISNPSISNPSISNAEVFNPSISNPSISNPSISNPSISNPSISNPSISNINVANPDIANPSISNVDVMNPSISNKELANPSISNPSISNAAMQDTTWTVTNNGNTAGSFDVSLLANKLPPNTVVTQLLVHSFYNSPVADACSLKQTSKTVLMANVPNPTFTTPGNAATNPASVPLAPGETVQLTLRVVDPNPPAPGVTSFQPAKAVQPMVTAQAVNTVDANNGVTQASTAGGAMTVTTTSLLHAVLGSNYQSVLHANGGYGAQTWSISGGGLPPGLMLTPASGIISGVATSLGQFNFTVQDQDSATPIDSATQGLSLLVVSPLVMTTTALPAGEVGHAYSVSVQTTGGFGTLTWSLASGALPGGLMLNGTTGAISGTPTTAGSFTFKVAVRDSNGPPQMVSGTFTIVVQAANAPTLTFVQQPSAAQSGQSISPAVTVVAKDFTGAVLPGVHVTLALAANPSGATLTGGAATTDATGTASFPSLSVSKAGAGYMVSTSATGFSGATSSAFNITPVGVNLSFAVQPGLSTGGQPITPIVQVQVQDNMGNPLAGINVMMALGTNPCAGTLTGATTVTTGPTGNAAFSNMAVTTGGASYTLVASATGATPLTSNPFTVVGFCPTGSMAVAHSGAVSVLLPNGKVLIAGGTNSGGSTADAELYDPGLGTFTPTGSMTTPRSGATAAMLSTGMVLIAGGQDSSGNDLASAELYDPNSGAFTLTGSMSTGRASHTATPLPNGRVLVAGGLIGPPGIPNTTASADLYDPSTGTFTATGSMLTAREGAQAVLLATGKVLVTGGFPGGAGVNLLSESELFDPASGTFSATGSMTVARSGFTLTLLNTGKVLVAGGYGTTLQGSDLSSAELYDPSTGLWTATGSMSMAAGSRTATLLGNGAVLVAGGALIGQAVYFSAAELYDPIAGSFSPTAGLATSRQGATATLLGNGDVLLAGGFNGSYQSSAELYLAFTAPPLRIGTLALPAGDLGHAYNAALNSSGGTGAVTWAVSAGELPPPLMLSPGGVISGTPTAAGIFNFTVQATDSGTPPQIAYQPLSIQILNTSATLSFQTQPVTVVAGQVMVPPPQVKVQNSSGPVIGQTVTLALGNNPSGATLSGATAVSGVGGLATFDTLSVSTFGAGYTLVASAPGFAGATSNGFNVLPAGATLTFLVQPSNGIAGQTITPAVQVRAADGMGLPISGVTVNLIFGANPGGATLAGATAITNISGIAAFPNLALSSTGVGYSLVATAPNFASGTSTAFNVYTGTPALSFLVQPSNAVAGQPITPDIQVLAQNGFGGPLAGITVTLAPGPNPPCAIPGMAMATTNASGIADFANIILDSGGIGFTAVASAPGVMSATSIPFNVIGPCNSANLTTVREAHTGTLLPNGKVLLAGGDDGVNVLATAELYDPTANTFTATGSLSPEREDHRAILLPTGKVLIVGGYDNTGNVLSSAQLYDPATGQFTVTGSMTIERDFPTATLLSTGKVLIAGGVDNLGNLLTSAELYDPATGMFTLTGSMTTGHWIGAATLLQNGKVLVTGGSTTVTSATTISNAAELYDPASGTFSPTGGMVQARRNHRMTTLANGMVLVTGGRDATGGTFASAELYDPAAGTFSSTGSMAVARRAQEQVLLVNGEVLVTGGIGVNTVAARLESYSPAAKDFRPSGNLMTERVSHSATLLANGKVLVAGGASNTAVLSTSELVSVSPAITTVALPDGTTVQPYNVPLQALGGTGTLTWNLVSGALPNGLNLGSAGVISGTPQAPGLFTFTVMVTDSGTPSETDTKILSLRVWSVAASTSLTFAVQPSNTENGLTIKPSVAVLAQNPSGPVSGVTVTLTLGTNPGAGVVTNGTAVTGPNGIAIFPNLSITGLSSGYTLIASAPGFAAAVSNPFEVVPVTPFLSFASQPGNIPQTSTQPFNPPVQVLAVDRNGTPISGLDVAMTLVTDPCAPGVFPFDSTVTGANGIATLDFFTFGNPIRDGGAGYVFDVTAPGAAALPSAPFNVAGFCRTGNLVAGRYISKSTLLPSGKMLVTGGGGTTNPNPPAINSAELYDPAAGTFSATGNMGTARFAHTSTLLPNGLVLIAGGQSGNTALSSAELYDPASGTFSPTGNLVNGRSYHTATLLPNGKVLIAGGFGGGTSAELYDPVAGTFALTGSMSATRAQHTATLLANGKVIVTGGTDGTVVFGSADVYDPTAGTFTPTGNMTSVRVYHTATLMANGKVLITGGRQTPLGPGLTTAEVYDPGSGTFVATGSMTFARSAHAAILLANGEVLVVGSQRIAEGYNPASGTFASVGRTALGHGGAFVAELLATGNVLIAGGASGPALVGGAELYYAFAGIPLKITTMALPDGNVGQPYNATLNAIGGTGALSWNVVAGALPSALMLSSSGAISGTPSGPGSSIFTAQVTDSGTPPMSAMAPLSINVTNSPGASLSFQVQPTSTVPGMTMSPPVQVLVQNSGGPVVGQTVTLTFGNNPGGATLSGGSAVTGAGGIATFSGLSVNVPGFGYTLVASASGFAGAASTPFDVAPVGANLVFLTQPSNGVAGQALVPAVQVRAGDGSGHGLAGVTITLGIGANRRSEERRVGKECGYQCRSRWSPYH